MVGQVLFALERFRALCSGFCLLLLLIDSMQHVGRYKCIVQNAAGSVESPQFNLVLLPGIPTIEVASGDHEAVLGERVTLHVSGAWQLLCFYCSYVCVGRMPSVPFDGVCNAAVSVFHTVFYPLVAVQPSGSLT